MRMKWAGLLAAVALAGCAAAGTNGYGPGPADYSTLSAHLFPTYGGDRSFAFDVSDAAYVAVFQVGYGGASLVYPLPGQGSMSNALNSGLHTIYGRRTAQTSRNVSFGGTVPYGPTVYMLIASEAPLNMENIGPWGDRLTWSLRRSDNFGSGSPHSMMEALVSMVVPDPSANNWTTDYYLEWPDDFYGAPSGDVILIACGERSIYVPYQYAAVAASYICQDEGVVESSDSTATEGLIEVRNPVRRTAKLRERIASTQLEDPAEWEARREAAEEGRYIEEREFQDNGGDNVRSSRPVDPISYNGRDDGRERLDVRDLSEDPAVGRLPAGARRARVPAVRRQRAVRVHRAQPEHPAEPSTPVSSDRSVRKAERSRQDRLPQGGGLAL